LQVEKEPSFGSDSISDTSHSGTINAEYYDVKNNPAQRNADESISSLIYLLRLGVSMFYHLNPICCDGMDLTPVNNTRMFKKVTPKTTIVPRCTQKVHKICEILTSETI
jgi:hypothetical protein